MKVKEIKLHQFRHFINQSLSFDPYVTVLIGKNDTGKTSILHRLFDQYIKNGGMAGWDISQLKNADPNSIRFNSLWVVEDKDIKNDKFTQLLGNKKPKLITICYQHRSDIPKNQSYSLLADTENINIYEDNTEFPAITEDMRNFEQSVLPKIRYINLSEKVALNELFEAQFYETGPCITETPLSDQPSEFMPFTTEKLLLSIVDLKANIRANHNVDAPWAETTKHNSPRLRPLNLTQEEIEQKLKELSEKITGVLQKWWRDPADLTFEIRLAGNSHSKESSYKRNSFLLTAQIRDENKLRYYGTGLNWFLTFVIEYLFIQKLENQTIVLFDEPACNLHPNAQRIVVKMLNELSQKHQVAYSTHSPFMIDWNFPQRIRLFTRNPKTKATKIDNKPYAPRDENKFLNIWDPLKVSIGVSFGDLGFLGEQNIFVEGISDQVILANISDYFKSNGKTHLDLTKISIIPCNDGAALEPFLKTASSQNKKSIVLCDSDDGNKDMIKVAEKCHTPTIEINQITGSSNQNESIEDLVGIDIYIKSVNDFYQGFDWFTPITPDKFNDCSLSIDSNWTLGRKLMQYFKLKLSKDFNKNGVAIHYANSLLNGSVKASESFIPLFVEINKSFN
ncbi:MAG: AAA family ATPase [Planctomycetes bacterium]|nr:AAA family ATPase [Planctomycetota bacterium]